MMQRRPCPLRRTSYMRRLFSPPAGCNEQSKLSSYYCSTVIRGGLHGSPTRGRRRQRTNEQVNKQARGVRTRRHTTTRGEPQMRDLDEAAVVALGLLALRGFEAFLIGALP
mmetsp:Transcript_24739/g.76420  ORF Transcript_24739/g.76420 Transcript_24739/m.76420 type:complete len:111 (+) Transcript_24739:612-944(+)